MSFFQSRYNQVTICFLALSFVISCSVMRSPDSEVSWYPFGQLMKKVNELKDYSSLKPSKEASPYLDIWSECPVVATDTTYDFSARVNFVSVMGSHTLKMNKQDEKTLKVKIDQNPTLTIGMPQSIKTFHDEYCRHRGIVDSVVKNPDWYQSEVAKVFAQVAPQCSASYQKESGWRCDLKHASVATVKANLKRERRKMIKSSRQPYTLSRKLALTSQLIGALESTETPHRLNILCKLMTLSREEERPLVFNNQENMQRFCDISNVNREALARVMLEYSYQEVKSLLSLFRSYSKLGLIQLKLPRSKIPSKDLWVTVVPKDPPEQHLKALRASLSKTSFQKELPATCWHPLFRSSDLFHMHKASSVGLIGSLEGQCMIKKSLDDRIAKDSYEYIYGSTSSETEFVVSNGNAKLLRLPKGRYYYSIQKHTKLPEHDAAKQLNIARGDFSWVARRPSVVVKKW